MILGRYRGNKGQFLIASALFLFLLLVIIYSQETDNSYIVKSSKYNLIENIVYETCSVGMMSNGSNIDGRYKSFAGNVSNYCNEFGYTCNLVIQNNTQIPPSGNWSLLNYTHYDYEITYKFEGYETSLNFTC